MEVQAIFGAISYHQISTTNTIPPFNPTSGQPMHSSKTVPPPSMPLFTLYR
jgi:hypothetical protein